MFLEYIFGSGKFIQIILLASSLVLIKSRVPELKVLDLGTRNKLLLRNLIKAYLVASKSI